MRGREIANLIPIDTPALFALSVGDQGMTHDTAHVREADLSAICVCVCFHACVCVRETVCVCVCVRVSVSVKFVKLSAHARTRDWAGCAPTGRTGELERESKKDRACQA